MHSFALCGEFNHFSFLYVLQKVTNEDGLIDVNSKFKVEEEAGGRKVWRCLECPRSFRSHSAMVAHVEGVHCNIKRFFCNVEGCSYGTYRKADLQTHLMVRIFLAYCSYKFTTRQINKHLSWPGNLLCSLYLQNFPTCCFFKFNLYFVYIQKREQICNG